MVSQPPTISNAAGATRMAQRIILPETRRLTLLSNLISRLYTKLYLNRRVWDGVAVPFLKLLLQVNQDTNVLFGLTNKFKVAYKSPDI
jgi:hypothetical protein